MTALLLLLALAGEPQLADPAAATAEAAALQVRLRQTLEIDRPGATAAYAVDDSLVEAAVEGGRVRIYGVRPGTTSLTIVGAAGVETIAVTVLAPPPRIAATAAAAARGASSFQAGYDSQTERLSLGIDASSRTAARVYRLRALGVTGTGSIEGPESGTSLPQLSLAVESRARSLVLGDERSVVSPLTVDGTSLRGVHWSSPRWLVHAGWSSATLYEDLFLPSQRESTAGASCRLRAGAATVTPSLFVFPSASPYGGASGALGSVLVGLGASGPLSGQAELGYGNRPVAAGELSYRGSAFQGRVEGRRQPAGTASLGLGRPHGTFVSGDGTERLGERVSLAGSFSVDHSDGPSFAHRSDAASMELRAQPARHLRMRTGARVGSYDALGAAPAARSFTVPVEAAWDSTRGGLSAVYRLENHSTRPGLMSGGRVGGHLRFPSVQASAYVDWQPSAVSIDAVLGANPGLARALAELSLTAQTPDDLARLLRENAALADLGYFDPASVRFDASRRQVGLDAAWSPAPRQRLVGRVLLDRTESAGAIRTTSLATVGYSRDVAGIEVFGSVSLYARGGLVSNTEPSFRVGIRRSFSGMPGLPRLGARAVSGSVFRDDAAAGRPGATPLGVPGAEVRLDDGRYTLTDDRGRFRFEDVRGGVRRVEVAAPTGAYFTTPSSADVRAGGEVVFGLAFSPARLTGLVRDDTGEGVAGARVRLSSAVASEAATTDSSGRFTFAVPPGEYTLALEPGSLAAGYAAPQDATRAVRLERDAPVQLEIAVAAQRSIAGRIDTACTAQVRVCLREESRCASPGVGGRYVFRGVKAGPLTVAAEGCGLAASRSVAVPAQPGAVGGVDLRLR